jgi:hypothetical protein
MPHRGGIPEHFIDLDAVALFSYLSVPFWMLPTKGGAATLFMAIAMRVE